MTYLSSLKQVLATGNLAHKMRDCPSLGCRALIPNFSHTSDLVLRLPNLCCIRSHFIKHLNIEEHKSGSNF